MPERRRSRRADAENLVRRLEEVNRELEIKPTLHELLNLPLVMFLHSQGYSMDFIAGRGGIRSRKVASLDRTIGWARSSVRGCNQNARSVLRFQLNRPKLRGGGQWGTMTVAKQASGTSGCWARRLPESGRV